MTVIYLAIEETLNDTKELEATRTELGTACDPLSRFRVPTQLMQWHSSLESQSGQLSLYCDLEDSLGRE